MEYCKQLDDYLDGDLTPQQASRFRQHVEVCGECRASLDAMAEFGSLVTEAKTAFDHWQTVNSDDSKQDAYLTLGSADSDTQVASRVLTSVAVVAATIAIMFVARTIANRPPVNPGSPEVVNAPNVDSDNHSNELAQRKRPKISMPNDSGYLAEPIKSSNPNITVYWLHPTVDAAKESESDEIDSSSTLEQETNLLARSTL